MSEAMRGGISEIERWGMGICRVGDWCLGVMEREESMECS